MRRDHVPVCARIEPDIAARHEVEPVHQPHRRRTVGVLPLDIGLAVAVDVAGAMNLPGRAGI